MPLTSGQWTDAIEQLRSENFFGAVILFHNGNQAATYGALVVLDDDTQTIVTPLEAELEAAYTRWQTAQNVVGAEQTQATSARAQLQAVMSGLHALSITDKGYALSARVFAKMNGESQATIDGIVDRPTAVAYITGLAEWQGMTVASRAFLAKKLEADAGLYMLLFVVLSG